MTKDEELGDILMEGSKDSLRELARKRDMDFRDNVGLKKNKEDKK